MIKLIIIIKPLILIRINKKKNKNHFKIKMRTNWMKMMILEMI